MWSDRLAPLSRQAFVEGLRHVLAARVPIDPLKPPACRGMVRPSTARPRCGLNAIFTGWINHPPSGSLQKHGSGFENCWPSASSGDLLYNFGLGVDPLGRTSVYRGKGLLPAPPLYV